MLNVFPCHFIVTVLILSYALAQQIKKILSKHMKEEQTGYMQKRFIGFNLRHIQHIIDFTDLYKIRGAI